MQQIGGRFKSVATPVRTMKMRWTSSSRALFAALVVLLWFLASMSASAAELPLTVSAGTLSNGRATATATQLDLRDGGVAEPSLKRRETVA